MLLEGTQQTEVEKQPKFYYWLILEVLHYAACITKETKVTYSLLVICSRKLTEEAFHFDAAAPPRAPPFFTTTGHSTVH